jgi:hypothetical protein
MFTIDQIHLDFVVNTGLAHNTGKPKKPVTPNRRAKTNRLEPSKRARASNFGFNLGGITFKTATDYESKLMVTVLDSVYALSPSSPSSRP